MESGIEPRVGRAASLEKLAKGKVEKVKIAVRLRPPTHRGAAALQFALKFGDRFTSPPVATEKR